MRNKPAALVLVPRHVTGELVNEDSSSYFASLTIDELKQEVREGLATVEASITTTTGGIRRLLTALTVLRERIPHGQWEKYLNSLHLKPATVRQWRHREREAVNDLAKMLGERDRRRKPDRRMSRSAAHDLADWGYKLARAVVAHRNTVPPPDVVLLAEDYIRAYDAEIA